MIACRAGRLNSNFLPTFLHLLSALFGIQIRRSFGLEHPWNTGQKNFGKNASKRDENTVAHFWERFWAFLEIWNCFDFFENFRRLDPPWNTGQTKFFEKNCVETCSKQVWTPLVTILGFYGILKFFWFFWNFSQTRPSMEHWAKVFFRKSYSKTCSKHIWTLLGSIVIISEILKVLYKSLLHFLSPENWTHIFKFGNLNS